jgi:hypothetical protein
MVSVLRKHLRISIWFLFILVFVIHLFIHPLVSIIFAGRFGCNQTSEFPHCGISFYIMSIVFVHWLNCCFITVTWSIWSLAYSCSGYTIIGTKYFDTLLYMSCFQLSVHILLSANWLLMCFTLLFYTCVRLTNKFYWLLI